MWEPPAHTDDFGTGPILAMASGCTSAVAIAAYPGSGQYDDGFETQDIHEEFEGAPFGAAPVAPLDSAFGGYVAFTICDGDHRFGFIGQRMEPWPPGTSVRPDRTFLWQLHHNFVSNEELRGVLADWMAGDVLPLAEAQLTANPGDTWTLSAFTQAPDGNPHSADGSYEAELYAPWVERAPPTSLRVWSRVADDEAGRKVYHAIDIVDSFTDPWLGASIIGELRHVGSDQHFQSPPVYLDNEQYVWAEVYGTFTRELRAGPVVVLAS